MLPRIHSLVLVSLFAATAVQAGGKEPVASAAPVAPVTDDGWSFVIRPYGWMTGLAGSTGVGGLTTNVDVDFAEVLEHLDMGFFLQAEARNGRWGILFDGFFAELSGGGSTPGELYSGANFALQQTYAELAVAYRVVEGPAGFLDVFAGARYNAIDLELDGQLDETGVRDFSRKASARVVDEIASRVRDAVESKSAALRTAAGGRLANLESDIAAEVAGRISDIHPRGPGLRPGSGPRDPHALVRRGIADEIRELAQARVAARVAALRSEVRRRAEARVAAAEKKLASAIERELKENLPQSVSGREEWVDPFLGVRGQWNFATDYYLAGRADIGGFGVGSDLTWQASAALGWQINQAWSTELGYRYLAPDFNDGGLSYEVASNGFFVSVGYAF